MSLGKNEFGSFTIQSINTIPMYEFTADIGFAPPLVVDGYGGWTVQDVPKRIGQTIWTGRQPIAVEIPFRLDNFRRVSGDPGVEVEQMIVQLNRLTGLGIDGQPPLCIVQSQGLIPHDYHGDPGTKWVIENVTWDGEIEIRNSVGNRVRCGGTLTVRQHIKHDQLSKLKITRSSGRASGRIYRVKRGDTLSKIAKRKDVYGDASKWRRIADANGIRDPHAKLKVDQKLRIP